VIALSRAPALPVLAGVATSLLMADGGAPWPAAALGSLAVAAACSLWGGRRPDPGAASVLAAVGLAAALLGAWTAWRVGEASRDRPSGVVAGRGTVVLERPWGSRRACLVDLPAGRFLLFLSPLEGVREGDRLLLRGIALPFRPPERAGGFDEGRYFRGRDARGRIEAESLRILSQVPPPLFALRRAIRERALLHLPPLTRGNVLAALLGVSDPDLAEDFRRWGISHLLAVSGGHVMLVAGIAWGLLRRFRRRVEATILLIWGYTLLSGAPGSAVRAAALASALLLGRLWGRPGAAFNAAGAAGLAILAARPALFWDLGFRLSLVCVLALAALPEAVPPGWLLPAGQGSTWLISSALCAPVFGSVPLAGLIANFPAIPVFALLMPPTVLLALPAMFLGPIAPAWGLSLVPEALWRLFGEGMELIARACPGSLDASPSLILGGTALFLLLCGRGMGYGWGGALAFSGAGGLLLRALL
jgi:competence protein ComEC